MKKILIVDDQLEVRELVEVTLRAGDYEVFQAESGEKAIEVAKAEMPELIIMDVMMPGGIDGFETTRTLKNDLVTKKCPIIMLGGSLINCLGPKCMWFNTNGCSGFKS